MSQDSTQRYQPTPPNSALKSRSPLKHQRTSSLLHRRDTEFSPLNDTFSLVESKRLKVANIILTDMALENEVLLSSAKSRKAQLGEEESVVFNYNTEMTPPPTSPLHVGGFKQSELNEYISQEDPTFPHGPPNNYFNEMFLVYDNTHDFGHKINPKKGMFNQDLYLPGRALKIKEQMFQNINKIISNIENYKGMFFHYLIYGGLVPGLLPKLDDITVDFYTEDSNLEYNSPDFDVLYDMGSNYKHMNHFYSEVQPSDRGVPIKYYNLKNNLFNEKAPAIFTILKMWDPSTSGGNNIGLNLLPNLQHSADLQNIISFVSFYKYFVHEFSFEKCWGYLNTDLPFPPDVSNNFDIWFPIVYTRVKANYEKTPTSPFKCKVYKFTKNSGTPDPSMNAICDSLIGFLTGPFSEYKQRREVKIKSIYTTDEKFDEILHILDKLKNEYKIEDTGIDLQELNISVNNLYYVQESYFGKDGSYNSIPDVDTINLITEKRNETDENPIETSEIKKLLEALIQAKESGDDDEKSRKIKIFLKMIYTFYLKNSGDVMQSYNTLNTGVYTQDIMALTKAIFDDSKYLSINNIKIAKVRQHDEQVERERDAAGDYIFKVSEDLNSNLGNFLPAGEGHMADYQYIVRKVERTLIERAESIIKNLIKIKMTRRRDGSKRQRKIDELDSTLVVTKQLFVDETNNLKNLRENSGRGSRKKIKEKIEKLQQLKTEIEKFEKNILNETQEKEKLMAEVDRLSIQITEQEKIIERLQSQDTVDEQSAAANILSELKNTLETNNFDLEFIKAAEILLEMQTEGEHSERAGAEAAGDAFDEEFDFITAFGLTQEDVSIIPCLDAGDFKEISYKDLSFNIVPQIFQAYPDLSTSFNKVKRAIIANNQYVAKMCYSVGILSSGLMGGGDAGGKEDTKGKLETFLISNYAIFTPGGATKYILNERKINEEIDTIHPICRRLCSMCMLDITDNNIITDICNFVEELVSDPEPDSLVAASSPITGSDPASASPPFPGSDPASASSPSPDEMDVEAAAPAREGTSSPITGSDPASGSPGTLELFSPASDPDETLPLVDVDSPSKGGRKTRRKKSKKHRKTKRR